MRSSASELPPSSPAASPPRIEIDDPARPEVRALLEEHLQSMRAISPPESVHALDIEELRRPGITFWSAWEGELLLGCGALKELDPAHGEVKSMRTPAAHRRRGAGRAILAHLVAVARARGYRRLSLETGAGADFAPAHRLYASFGFRDCGPFAGYRDDPNSRFLTLSLGPVATPARFLTAEWRDLVMLNYEVDPGVLAPLVPAGTELDLWQGSALVSVVGFRFLHTRVLGLAIPWHVNFEEVNLRFYVRRAGPEGLRRGVVFVKELVPRAAIAWVARTLYNENYVALPMRHEIVEHPEIAARRVDYSWRLDGRWCRVGVTAGVPPGGAVIPPPDSEATFITEHYWGYARQRDGGTVEYRVEHPQWRVSAATESDFECDVAALYGGEFAGALAGEPRSAFLADGSAVTVRRGIDLR